MATKTAKQQAKPLKSLYFLWIAALLSLASDLKPLRSQETGVPKRNFPPTFELNVPKGRQLTEEEFRALWKQLEDIDKWAKEMRSAEEARHDAFMKAMKRLETDEASKEIAPREIVEKYIQKWEWVLELKLTDQGRQTVQEYCNVYWQQWDGRTRNKFSTDVESSYASMQALINSNNQYKIHISHAIWLEANLEKLRNSQNQLERWWLAQYESIYRPGGEGNPVLVPGNPPLTQQMVNKYCSYVEVAIDVSLSGGLTGPERETLKGYVVTDWQRDKASQQEIFAALKEWHNIALKPPAEQDQWVNALRSRFVAHLRTYSQEERNQWLLQIHGREQERLSLLIRQRRDQQNKDAAIKALIEEGRHKAAEAAIKSTVPSERWP